jgi:hypothetical protein
MKQLVLLVALFGVSVCGGEAASPSPSASAKAEHAPKQSSSSRVEEKAASDSAKNNSTRQPIIHLGMPKLQGNVNGPCLIRVPDWIPPKKRAHRSAKYYLYFAHHSGSNIRMAWAAHVTGPYTIYKPGVGVLSARLEREHLKLGYHVASPDVHVDDDNQRIIMYFHSDMMYDGKPVHGSHGQHTGVATSPDGLDFNAGLEDMAICPFYARVFSFDGELYAFTIFGQLWKARDAAHPWTNPPPGGALIDVAANGGLWEMVSDPKNRWDKKTNPFESFDKQIRHLALRRRGDKLDVFYSLYNSAPEHIEYSTIDISVGVEKWRATPPVSVLKPTLSWEGADLPIAPSGLGGAIGVHQLRDPYVFKDIDGTEYLLYTGRGEEAIGMIPLKSLLDDKKALDDAGARPQECSPSTPHSCTSEKMSVKKRVVRKKRSRH